VLKSTFAGSPRWEAAKIVVNEITVVGSRCGRFAPAIDLLTTGEIPVKQMIEKVYTLGDGVAAMEHAARKGTMKILLKNAE
jgi:threonine dehydrogenase-like Zn-dependent dehydrogenase